MSLDFDRADVGHAQNVVLLENRDVHPQARLLDPRFHIRCNCISLRLAKAGVNRVCSFNVTNTAFRVDVSGL